MHGWLRNILRFGGVRTRLHDPESFRETLDRERSRVNRSGSVFSLLSLGPADLSRLGEVEQVIGVLLQERLRSTDAMGLLSEHRIGILLPDTVAAGARELFQDLGKTLGAKGIAIEGEVAIYPNQNTTEIADRVDEQENPRPCETTLMDCLTLSTKLNTPAQS